MSESESEYSESDVELQEALAAGLLKPGLNEVSEVPKQCANNVAGIRRTLDSIKMDLPWIECLDLTNKPAPLAPELAAQILEQESRSNKSKNKKSALVSVENDPVVNDFKRETNFYRQAQAAVMEGLQRIKALGILTKRPEDYFAEMAKTDEHMQKIRDSLMQRKHQQERIEKVRQLRQQRKDGKASQIQTALHRQREKREMLDAIKKARKGRNNDLSFLDNNKSGKSNAKKNTLQKRKWKDDKYGFGGRKKGSKKNTRESSTDGSSFERPGTNNKGGRKSGKKDIKSQRPGKTRRIKNKNKK